MNIPFLPLLIVVVMLSLGLTLTFADFRRIAKIRRPVIVAVICQIVLLPVVCVGVIKLFHLPPVLAVGLMLMAATPGGTTANLFSHLANGDLALNLTLTAVNAVLSIFTLPLILGLSFALFMGHDRSIPLQYTKFLQVFGLILIPISIGMIIRERFPVLAERLKRPIKILAGTFLVLIGGLALVTNWKTLTEYFWVLGGAVVSFNLISLMVGYAIPRFMSLDQRQSIAISLEVGLHNGALAVAIAMSPSLLNNPDMAMPGALYGVLAIFVATAFILVIKRLDRAAIPAPLQA